MSYDVFFWREEPGAKVDPGRVLDALEDTVALPGILPMPVDVVKRAFCQQFPDIVEDAASMQRQSEAGAFDVNFTFSDERTVSLTTVCCSYSAASAGGTLEQLRTVAAALGCRFYDPHERKPKRSFFRRFFT